MFIFLRVYTGGREAGRNGRGEREKEGETEKGGIAGRERW